jgi:hypothetical protein
MAELGVFLMSSDPTVKSPGTGSPRMGRGYSKTEAKEAGLTINEVRRMGLMLDLRRKTTYPENVEALKLYIKEIEQVAKAVTKKKKPTKDITAAITELSSLRAVKKAEAEILAGAGILSIEDLAYCDIKKVMNKTKIEEERLTAMVKAALKKV